LIAAVIGYCVLVVTAYLHVTSPGSLWPDTHELGQILFDTAKPVTQIERLLETPEGEMNRGGTMRPAFNDQSLGWEELIKPLSAGEIAALRAEREGERLALLDWVRSGGNQAAYDADDYTWANSSSSIPISAAYLASESGDSATAARRIRIRSLITDRCVTCHGEQGRHDIARFISLETYERLQPHLQPEIATSDGRPWLIATLVGLYPLALISGLAFFFTSHPARARRLLLATTFIALGGMSACWLAGRTDSYAIYVLLATAGLAAIGALVQTIATLAELLKTDGR
jgi:hypothetical protein